MSLAPLRATGHGPLASLRRRRLLSSRLIDAPWNPFDQYLAPHYVTTSLVRGKLFVTFTKFKLIFGDLDLVNLQLIKDMLTIC